LQTVPGFNLLLFMAGIIGDYGGAGLVFAGANALGV
jgi:hypothetical protein